MYVYKVLLNCEVLWVFLSPREQIDSQTWGLVDLEEGSDPIPDTWVIKWVLRAFCVPPIVLRGCWLFWTLRPIRLWRERAWGSRSEALTLIANSTHLYNTLIFTEHFVCILFHLFAQTPCEVHIYVLYFTMEQTDSEKLSADFYLCWVPQVLSVRGRMRA